MSEHLLYFRNDRERYLRREVIDPYLRGEKVSEDELREAVLYLCEKISAVGDALAMHKCPSQKLPDHKLPPKRPLIRRVR